MLKLSDFDYALPKELIAQFPCERRDESRLLVLDRNTGQIEHKLFKDIVEYFNKGDALVLNNTKVLPVRLIGKKSTGGRIEILLCNPTEPSLLPNSHVQPLRRCHFTSVIARSPDIEKCRDDEAISKKRLLRPFGTRNDSWVTDSEYEGLARPLGRIKIGSRIDFGNGELKADVMRIYNGKIFLKFHYNGSFYNLLKEFGKTPLPPYIKREAEDIDRKRYQTVYAKREGAIAAPTAGLHFTKTLLKKIENKGIKIEYLTLQVGFGTFKPVKCKDVRLHKMEEEYFEVSKDAIGRLKEIKRKGGRIFAVGTTTCRVLETVANNLINIEEQLFNADLRKSNADSRRFNYQENLRPSACNLRESASKYTPSICGWTDLFIHPPYKFKFTDALITNFHLPKTTLLMLVGAFCGRELLFKAYQEAIERQYRFYSYGDAMLIL